MNRNGASDLPTWDLSDLYSGIDDPQIEADLSRAEQRAVAFEERYRGQIGRSGLTAARMREARSSEEFDSRTAERSPKKRPDSHTLH